MKVGQILSYVDGSLDPEARQLLAVLPRWIIGGSVAVE
jgi:hypothetical protein